MKRRRTTKSRAKLAPKRKRGYLTSALGKKKALCLRTRSPLSAPLSASLPHAQVSGAKAVKRANEDGMWRAYVNGGGETERNALWVYYQPLVRYIAGRLKAKLPESIDLHDLIGAGNIGLQDAITKFRPAVGVRFETYCVPRIRGAIVDSIRALDWVPRLIRNKTHQYTRIVRELASQLRREPTPEEIARRLGMKAAEFSELQKELDIKAQVSVEGASKDSAGDRDPLRIDMLLHTGDVEPTRNLQREEIREMALRGLNPKERIVVEQYYFQGRSMKQIGDDLGLSESRICQIHSQVMEILRVKFKSYGDSPSLD